MVSFCSSQGHFVEEQSKQLMFSSEKEKIEQKKTVYYYYAASQKSIVNLFQSQRESRGISKNKSHYRSDF